MKIVKVRIMDNELSDWRDTSYHESYPNGELETYYLVNPDETKLEKLKNMIEHRWDFEDNENLSEEEYEKARETADCILQTANDFIKENFTVLNISETIDISY